MDSIGTVDQTEINGVPDSYWLRDTMGRRIETWNGFYRLNLTKPEVAIFQARYAYKRILDSNLSMDGVFFDNFFTTISGMKQDKWGNAIELDADEDGKLDDPAWLDDAWRKGVFAELREFRRLMPYALTPGHLEDYGIAEEAEFFSGDSLGFVAPWVKEGRYGPYSLAKVWEPYHSWWDFGQAPLFVSIEGAPPSELSYGYGEQPVKNMPAATLEFAKNFFPYMRWGLGLTLMNDGYYNYSQGDSGHGLDWWFDEFDVNLGYPKGAFQRINLGTTGTTDSIRNGGFESGLAPTWEASVNTNRGAAATFTLETAPAGSNSTACRVDVTKITIDPAGNIREWDVALNQLNLTITAGVAYDLSFRACSTNAEHPINIGMQKPTAPYDAYLENVITLKVGNTWQTHTGIILAKATATDARLSLNVGSRVGTVWIDDVKLVPHLPDLYRRDFDNGTVILNASEVRQTIPVSGSYKRLTGTQAPRYLYVIDDVDSAFTAGNWTAVNYDSGLGDKAPWYHDWGNGCHQSSSTADTATWALGIRADDIYTLDAWWPAAPAATNWSSAVRYDVMVNGSVVATTTIDQTRNGDQWNRIASVALTKAAGAQVRITNLQSKPAIADAILVQSTARYNDGSDAPSVELDAKDAIILLKK
ncbi:MAG: carbohydrate binding domain-containing protein [Verrucomicrobia bacterium]|nr:carbohydrate binding domain-containing protein [Verrucomicrobiota bacterium]